MNIAVDMLVATYENLCDRIILVSSDTELLPAVLKAKTKGKLVEYVGFSHKPSVAMVANCSKSKLLEKSDLKKFLRKNRKEKKIKLRLRAILVLCRQLIFAMPKLPSSKPREVVRKLKKL